MTDLYPNHLLEEMDDNDTAEDKKEKLAESAPSPKSSTTKDKSVPKFDIPSSLMSMWGLITILVCFFACSVYFVLGTLSCSAKAASFNDIVEQVASLRKEFPSQDLSLWAGIISGLKNLEKEPVEPAVYLLTFNEDSIRASTCIVGVITALATKLLQPCETEKWLLLNGTSLSQSSSKDPGDLIEAITRENEHSQIVVVPDVQKIPAKLAKGFHALVDTYGNMAKRSGAVYIFTLMIPRVDDLSTITRVVEDILLQTWKELDRDELQPLVTRISHFILPVTKEDKTYFCPLKIGSTVDVEIP